MMTTVISLVLIAVGILLDLGTKTLILANMEYGQVIELIPNVLVFQLDFNTGSGFGMFQEPHLRWIPRVLSGIAIIAIFVFMFWKRPKDKLLLSALILIQAGGIANMIERIFVGQVTDFVYFCAFPSVWRYIFNVADSYVTVGAGLMILWLILDLVRDIKAEKAKAAEEAAALKEAEQDDDAE